MTFVKHFLISLLILVLANSVFSQENKTILANHKKGGHSIGGIALPLFWSYYSNSFYNLRYGYFFSDRNEIGIDFLAYGWAQSPPGRVTRGYSDYIYSSLYYRRYLGKNRFGVFVEGGYKLMGERCQNYSFNEAQGTITYEDGYHLDFFRHHFYGTLGLYYHGLAKGRLGTEFGLGMGPSYHLTTGSWDVIPDLQFRIKYFFKNKNYPTAN